MVCIHSFTCVTETVSLKLEPLSVLILTMDYDYLYLKVVASGEL